MAETPDLRDQIAQAISDADRDGTATYAGMAAIAWSQVLPLLAERDQLAADRAAIVRGIIAERDEAWQENARLRAERDNLRTAANTLRGDVLVAGQAIARWRDRYFNMARERDAARAEVERLRAELTNRRCTLGEPFKTWTTYVGKAVRATLDGTGKVHETGTLVALDEGGEAVILGEDGHHRWCWPVLAMELTPAAPESDLAGLAARDQAAALTSDEAVEVIKERYGDAITTLADHGPGGASPQVAPLAKHGGGTGTEPSQEEKAAMWYSPALRKRCPGIAAPENADIDTVRRATLGERAGELNPPAPFEASDPQFDSDLRAREAAESDRAADQQETP